MPRTSRSRPAQVLVGLLVVAVLAGAAIGGVVGVRWWRDSHRTDLQRALALAPDSSERFSWTDWAAVRRQLGDDLDADSTPDQLRQFLDDGFDADLTSTSSMVDSAEALQALYGFSPASVDWELLSQGPDGAVTVMGVGDDVDLDAVGDQLEESGFGRPATSDGVWEGGGELLSRLGGGTTISPQFSYVALDEEDHLIRASDSRSFLDKTRDADDFTSLDDVAKAVDEPLSAQLYTGDFACTTLAMSQADDSDRLEADQLLADAGKVNPLAGFAIADVPGGTVRVAMGFENDDQARTNADSRAALASGPAPGQGGDFADRFTLGKVEADGPVVTMELKPTEGSFVLSDLSTGPVLFATC